MMARAVESLVGQTAPADEFEIVIVDNGSTDDTRERAQRLVGQHSSHTIRYVYEERPGIAFARNAGTAASTGEYVASIDDDAAAEPDWIERISSLVTTREYVALGGRILPLYEVPKPPWFQDAYEERTWGTERRFLGKDESFSASNMVVKRSALERVGGFPTDVGMSGDRLMVGEEPMLFKRLWESEDCAGKILYDPDLRVRHSVPAHKMRVFTGAARNFVNGQYTARVIKSTGKSRTVAALRSLASVFIKFFVGIGLVFKAKSARQWVYEAAEGVAQPLGRLLALIGIEPKVRRR